MMFLPSFLKEFHQSWFRYSKEPTFPYSGQYLKLLILNVFLAFKGDTPQSEHFHDLIMRFHQVYVFWRYHVAWSNMSQVMCTVPTLGSEWRDTSAGPKGQSTSFSLQSLLYFLMGFDCASTRGIFGKHSNGMNESHLFYLYTCLSLLSIKSMWHHAKCTSKEFAQLPSHGKVESKERIANDATAARGSENSTPFFEGFFPIFWIQPFWSI